MAYRDAVLSKAIGLRLGDIRRARGLTLSQLSAQTRSLSKSRISNYEQGLRRMGIEEARELAAALGNVSAIYLLCLDDEQYQTDGERKLVERIEGSGLPSPIVLQICGFTPIRCPADSQFGSPAASTPRR